MLKTQVGDELWLVHQPDHARVSGYLAAHWGGVNAFTRPGHYQGAAVPEVWREEVVLAIAEHDNGWWEWEAMPAIDSRDGLPRGLEDIGRDKPDEGLDRWRLGVPRLEEQHPYAALLISLHATGLYRFAFSDLAEESDDALRHPLFGGWEASAQLLADPNLTRAFLAEHEAFQDRMRNRLRANPVWQDALETVHLHPHLKLLQLLDAMSLLLSFGAKSAEQLSDIPRRSWDDRVTIGWRPWAERRVVCDPYPFDRDPLEVPVPARVWTNGRSWSEEDGVLPLTRLHSMPLQVIRFELGSKGD
jgi:hypothetical protein